MKIRNPKRFAERIILGVLSGHAGLAAAEKQFLRHHGEAGLLRSDLGQIFGAGLECFKICGLTKRHDVFCREIITGAVRIFRPCDVLDHLTRGRSAH
jgi:hypothetical protein